MFTGIVTDIGRVRSLTANGVTRCVIATAYDTATIAIGASVCCAGCCLTAVETGDDWFAVEASAETLSRTTLGRWQEGTAVNLERALKAGDELGGHIVSGHVDGIGRVTGRREDGDSVRLTFDAPRDLSPMIAAKGSVTVDGVSLTVNEVDAEAFGVNVIPHTLVATTLGGLAPGDPVNLEIDMLARYVARLLAEDRP